MIKNKILLLLLTTKIMADCNNLVVTIPYSTGWGIDTKHSSCEHGKIVSISDSQANLSDVNGGSYGPSCYLNLVPLVALHQGFDKEANESHVEIKAQQNFCFLEAGAVHFENEDSAHYIIKHKDEEGSFAQNPGNITINSVLRK